MSRAKGRLAAAAALGAIVLWRLVARPPGELWRDPALLGALYGLGTLLGRPSAGLDLAAAGYLLGLYAASQGPRLLSILGLGG